MKTSELDRLLTPAKRAVYDRDIEKAFKQLFIIIEKLNAENETLTKVVETISSSQKELLIERLNKELKGDSKWANTSIHQI